MESTGSDHYQLAYYLLEKSIKVFVENLLSVKLIYIEEIIKNKDRQKWLQTDVSMLNTLN